MPTNEERREVAARLRNYENLRESFRESPICAFIDALWVGYLDWEGVCSRLAYLIEPEPERTCKFIPFIEDDGSVFVENCSECDAAVLSRCEFNYCPKCGAKVIDNER